MKTNRGREIPAKVERALWGISAGRCEFEGCNIYLGINPITKEEGNYAEKAHIEAVSKGGPRYRELMENEDLNSVDNLMLMCARCHKCIDEKPDEYPVERLQSMKRKHEERVYWQTEIDDVQKSYMIGYFANIHDYFPEYENHLFRRAVVRDCKIPSEKYIKFLGNANMPFNDGSAEFYMTETAVLKNGIERIVKTVIQHEENISVFALAPIPLLIKLGELLGDISNVSVFQCHRNNEKWSWDDKNTDRVDFMVQRVGNINQNIVALNISLSADIIQQRIEDVVEGISTYKLSIKEPNRIFVKNKMVMNDFVQAFRKCMEQIKKENPQIEKVLVFPAMPNSLAIRMGMDYMPKTDPVLEIYDQVEAGQKFVKTILIGEE